MTLRFLGHITYKKCNFVYKYNGTDDHLDNTDFNEIFSNGHTARGILVYVLRNLLNSRGILGDYFEVEIRKNSLFLYKEYSLDINEQHDLPKMYSFHAFNLEYKHLLKNSKSREEHREKMKILEEKIREKIREEYEEYNDGEVDGHFCAVLDQSEDSIVNFFKLSPLAYSF